MKLIIFITFTFLFVLFFFKDKTKCWNDIDFQKTEFLLKKLPVKKKEVIKSYNDEKPDVSLIYFENNLKAIFKPERELLEQASALRAYHLSQLLDFNFVPPTVIRTIDGKRGMLRLFVEGTSGDQLDSIVLKEKEKNKIYIFYFILGEIDHARKDLVIGNNCRKPALFDSDENMMFFSVIRYGDFPYFRYPAINNNLTNNIDYRSFPFNEVRKVSIFDKTQLKKIFKDMEQIYLDDLIHADLKDNNVWENMLYYIKWKNFFWIQLNLKDVSHIYKDFVPTSISKKTIRRLKKLNRNDLNSFSSLINRYFIEEESLFILKNIKTLNELSLYKRDIFLKKLK